MNGKHSILSLTIISLSLGLFSGCCANSPPSSEKSEVKQEQQYMGEVSVQGFVNRPCSVKIPKEGLTLGQAIEQAGGFMPRAWKRDIRISRMNEGTKVIFTVDYLEIASGKSPDVYLREGDLIQVEDRVL